MLAAAAATTTPAPVDKTALVKKYCVVCHNDKLSNGGLSFKGLDFADLQKNGSVLERMARKVKSGEMPPVDMPRPAEAVLGSFVKSIEPSLDHAAAANPNPGRPAVHRLNRAEYSNAIRDVLALDVQPGASLPADDSGYGFDNIGDVLSMSPALLDRYLSVARMVSRLAVGNTNIKPSTEEISARQNAPGGPGKDRNERVSDDLPFDSRGGFSVQYYFPVDAEYSLRLRVNPGRGGPFEIRMPVAAGLRTIGATFLRESAKPEMALARRGPPPAPADVKNVELLPAQLDLRIDGVRVKRFQVPQTDNATPQVNGLTWTGPYKITGPGDTPSRARIFVCRPAQEAPAAEEEPCARKILASIARRAFRRPVTDADIDPLMAFYRDGRQERDFDFGIEKSLRALLVAPDFLFRVERDPAGMKPGTVYRISDVELASRLSFFLWSTVPDDQLLELAEKGKLKEPAVLEQQVRRLLADPRADALVSNFAGQWLYIRGLTDLKPDPDIFSEFDESLRQSFKRETELFFRNILRENRSVNELLDANYTFLNQRLAEHYGIENIYGSQFRKVALTDHNRGGLLGQGSILAVTSYPNRTSVVQRGKWVLENLLGAPPPPPPPGVPDLVSHKDGKPLTMRQAMEQHRADPVCASCHARMDPIGFALENYDGVGKWRDKEAGATIDASGKLPGGAKFVQPAGLKKLLLAGYRDQFDTTVTEKLLTYALGRGLEYYDKSAVRAIMKQAAQEDFRMSALISGIVRGTPFQMRRVPELESRPSMELGNDHH